MFGINKKAKAPSDILLNVATAGTPEPISATSKFCKSVTIQALASNTANVAIGGESTVDLSAETGVVLTPGNSLTMNAVDLKDIWVDVGVNTEGVSVTYEEMRTLV